jgi:hypothetical protein
VLVLRAVQERLGEHGASCRAGYALGGGFLFAGIALGGAAAGGLSRLQRLTLLHGLSAAVHGGPPASLLVGQGLLTLAVWAVLGWSVVGLPLLAVAMGLRGFVLGFAAAFLVATLGLTGAAAVAVAVVPAALPALLGQLVAMAVAVRFAQAVVAGRGRGGYLGAWVQSVPGLSLASLAVGVASLLEAGWSKPVLIALLAGR